MIFYAGCLFTGFLLSAFFSGSETGFMSLDRFRIKHLSKQGNRRAAFLEYCQKHQLELIANMLVGTNLSNVFSAAMLTLLLTALFSSAAVGRVLEFGYALFLILFAELIPKILFRRYPTTLMMTFVPVYRFFMKVFRPVVMIFQSIPGLGNLKSVHKEFFSKEELRTLVEKAEKTGGLEQDETEMIHGIFSFGETRAREIMTPRVDIHTLDKKMSIQEMFNKASEQLYSRYLVIDDDIDKVLGFVHIFDLFSAMHNNLSLDQILRDVYYVPQTKMIDDIFKEMRQGANTLTLVVDEYGGTAGIITFEDIIEEVVGDIVEAHDRDSPLMVRHEDGSVLVDARADLDETAEFVGFSLPGDQDAETVGGFVQNLFGAIPRIGDTIHHEGFIFYVTLADKRKVIRLKIYPNPLNPEKE